MRRPLIAREWFMLGIIAGAIVDKIICVLYP